MKKKCATKFCRNERVPGRRYCYKCHMRRFKELQPISYAYMVLKGNAKRRGKEFSLTRDEFKEFCHKTGYINGKGKTPESMSIDRIDASRGYSIDNIRILTLSENSIRDNKERNNCPF